MRAAKRVLAAASAILLVWGQTAVVAPPVRAEAIARPPTAATDLRRLADAMARVRTRLDRTLFDPAALGRALGDPRTAWRFVREQIGLLPAPGLSRFAAGTLASRAGTVCDRALLLAEMVRAQGWRVRLAGGRLDERLRTTLAAAVRPPAVQPDVLPTDVDRLMLAALAEAGMPLDPQRALGELAARVRRLVTNVEVDLFAAEALLRAQGIWRAGERSHERPGADAFAEHCWVQVREGDRWTDLDPTPLVTAPGMRVVEPMWTAGAAPAELAPRLWLEVVLVREGAQAGEKTVLRFEARLTRAIETFTFAVQPRGRGGRPLALVLRYRDRVMTGEPFDPAGRRGAAGLPTGDLFGGALNALLSELEPGTPAPATARAGLLLRVGQVDPDGVRWRAERWLVPPGAVDDARRWIVASELLVTASRLPRAWVLDRMAEGLAAAASLAARGEDGGLTPDQASRVPVRLPALTGFAAWRGRFADALLAALFPGAMAVPEGPLVVARHLRAGREGGLRVDFDVIRARERVIAPGRDDVDTLRAERLLSLLDDLLEHHLAGSVRESGLFWLRRMREVPEALRLVAGPGADPGAVPPELARFVRADLAAGARLLLPAGTTDLPFGYWRFEEPRGLAQFVGSYGYGQETSEYSTLEVFVIRGAIAVFVAGGACAVDAGLRLVAGADHGLGAVAQCLVVQTVTILLTLYLFPTPGVQPGFEGFQSELGKGLLGGLVSGGVGGLWPEGGSPSGGQVPAGGDDGMPDPRGIPTPWGGYVDAGTPSSGPGTAPASADAGIPGGVASGGGAGSGAAGPGPVLGEEPGSRRVGAPMVIAPILARPPGDAKADGGAPGRRKGQGARSTGGR